MENETMTGSSIAESCKQRRRGDEVPKKKGMKVPKWVESLTKKTFFGSCPVHDELELNGYCIECDLAVCKHCIISSSSSHHQQHNILKIYRHVYQDVVLFDEIKPYLDISKIQLEACSIEKTDDEENQNTTNSRKRKRKATPHRAPFF
ncbi:PREDICTED: uncharacterized protein LOC109187413 [Ipomoea nil]|uniref:uncharacterized protein LOC109187413 n=1 Tax=Ipomoea nil TaxID=35883 RepID=UPI000900E8E9|nr:PREDICTED: uncharacterized protein LOC109187413 [Ipomoea nil]